MEVDTCRELAQREKTVKHLQMEWRNLQYFDENMVFPMLSPKCSSCWLFQPINVHLTTSQPIISHDTNIIISHDTNIGNLGSSVCVWCVPFLVLDSRTGGQNNKIDNTIWIWSPLEQSKLNFRILLSPDNKPGYVVGNACLIQVRELHIGVIITLFPLTVYPIFLLVLEWAANI